MARIADILQQIWPGAEWSITEDDYDTLNWRESNQQTKPTEEEIRSHSADVDVVLADNAQKARQQQAMADAPDYLLKVIEVLIEGMIEIRRVVNDIRSTMVPAAHTGSFTTWDNDIVTRIGALRQRVIDLRNVE